MSNYVTYASMQLCHIMHSLFNGNCQACLTNTVQFVSAPIMDQYRQ